MKTVPLGSDLIKCIFGIDVDITKDVPVTDTYFDHLSFWASPEAKGVTGWCPCVSPCVHCGVVGFTSIKKKKGFREYDSCMECNRPHDGTNPQRLSASDYSLIFRKKLAQAIYPFQEYED